MTIRQTLQTNGRGSQSRSCSRRRARQRFLSPAKRQAPCQRARCWAQVITIPFSPTLGCAMRASCSACGPPGRLGAGASARSAAVRHACAAGALRQAANCGGRDRSAGRAAQASTAAPGLALHGTGSRRRSAGSRAAAGARTQLARSLSARVERQQQQQRPCGAAGRRDAGLQLARPPSSAPLPARLRACSSPRVVQRPCLGACCAQRERVRCSVGGR
jgi:hypothetical protein